MKPLVIFDCDGVLVDTEVPANNRMAEIFSGLGLPMTGTECRRRFQGMSMTTVCNEISDLLDINVHSDDLQNEVNQALNSGVKAIEGVEKVVGALISSGIDVCVASSGTIEKMHLTLGQTSMLADLQPVLFSASQVARGKPHPDIFELAANSMGYHPEHCIIVEDSLAGVQAGRAAGMHVLGYCGDSFTPKTDLCNAGAQIISRMAEVLPIVRSHGTTDA